jgi:general secretion pathway protein B
MSLILEALRKADAERERGAVPGLHAQPVPPVPVENAPAPSARPWLWAVLGLGAGVVAATVFYLLMRGNPAPAVTTAASAAAPAPAPAPVAPPAANASPAQAANPAAALPPVAEPAPWPPPDGRKPGERPGDKPAEAPAAPVVLGNVVAGEPAPLPDFLRAQLPQFSYGGSIYSSNPANRSLIIDGRLYREGEQVTPDVKLETIKPKGAVLLFRGYRYEVQL